MTEMATSPLRRRMIEDMTVRNFVEKTQNDSIRHVQNLTAFLRRSPDTATAEDLRLYQMAMTFLRGRCGRPVVEPLAASRGCLPGEGLMSEVNAFIGLDVHKDT